MALACKLMAQVAFKAGGDVFHRLFTKNPHHWSKITPAKVQACELHQGDYGTNGSVVEWKFTADGKEQSVKAIVLDIDEERKQIAYKMIAGHMLELYTNILFTFHVETKGGVDYATWTMEYELLDANNPHPVYLVSFIIECLKDAEAHIFG